MGRSFSIYLDLLRFVAACLVVVYHSNSRLIVESVLPLSRYGHSAVIVFFVLSGFVIAFATHTKERSARVYWASRLSRVLSLSVPVVLLTPVLDVIGESLAPALYDGNTTHGLAAVRIVSSLAFLNEVWSLSIMCFSNIAYWSLNYEVWYYALFAIYAFAPARQRWWWFGGLCLLLGPKILLLGPIWCLGVVIYRWQAPQRMPEWMGWACAAASVLLFIGFDQAAVTEQLTQWLKSQLGAHWHRELAFSKWFLSDYLLAGIVFLHFIGVRRIIDRAEPLCLLVERPVRAVAAYTFSLYILHQPLIYFFAAIIPLPPTGYSRYALVMGGVAVTVLLVGRVTERKRHLLRQAVLAVFDRVAASAAWQRLAARGARP